MKGSPWIAALSKPNDPDALTAREIGELLGCNPTVAQRRVATLVRAKRAIVTSKRIQRADGRWLTVAAYKLVSAKAA